MYFYFKRVARFLFSIICSMKICNEHDYAIVSRFLRYYLIQLHEIKKKTLQTIFREIVLLHVKNFRQIQNLVNDFLVVYLLVEIDYRCETITCNDNFFDFVNKNKRTMKKYLSRIHEIQKSKKNKTRFTRNYIEIVNLQFFLSKSHYRFFVVRVELVSRAFFFFSHDFVDARNSKNLEFFANEFQSTIDQQSRYLNAKI